MHFFQLVLDTVQTDARNAAVHTWEIFRNHRTRQAHSFKVKATAIGRENRNTHLRHDLQQTSVDSSAVVFNSVRQRQIDQATFNTIRERVLCQISVHSGRATADQNSKVMRVDTFSRTHVDRCERPQTFAGQPRMDRRRREDHRHRNFVFVLMFVGQNDVTSARTHRIFCLGTNASQALTQGFLIRSSFERTINERNAIAELFDHFVEFSIANKRAFQNQNFGLRAVFVEHVLEVTEPRLQRHHACFTQRVDRRVGDLREILTEEVRQRTVLFRQNRRRRIVTHRRDEFLAVLGHRCQNLLKLFE